jgi:hypothetical protein
MSYNLFHNYFGGFMRLFGRHFPFLWPFCVFMLLTGFLLQSRCTFKSPSKPVWQVQLEIPLINRVFSMKDIIDDTDELTVDSVAQEVVFTFEEEIDTALVGEYLSVDGIAIDNIYPLGNISDSIAMADSLIIERGEIKKGSVYFQIENDNPFDVHVIFELPDLKENGNPFIIDRIVAGFFSNTRELEGYSFTPSLVGDQNFVRFYAQAFGNGSPGTVQIRLEINDVSFYSVRGWLKDVDVSIEETEQEITIPEEIKGLKIASADMKLKMLNGIQAPGAMNLWIEGINGDLEQEVLHIEDEIDAAPGPGQVGETTIHADVTDFINILPSTVRYWGTIKVGKGYTPGDTLEIRQDDFVTGTVVFSAPLIIEIESRTNQGEVDTVRIGKGTRDVVRDNLKEISIVTEIENHTPLSADVSLLFSKTVGDSTLYEFYDQNPNNFLTIGPLSLAEAELVVSEIFSSGTIWAVGESGTSQWNQVLIEGRDIGYFTEEEIYMGVKIVFKGTQGKQVKVMPSDYIRIKAYGSVQALTKIPENAEEGGDE